jgi:hypothetical protein
MILDRLNLPRHSEAIYMYVQRRHKDPHSGCWGLQKACVLTLLLDCHDFAVSWSDNQVFTLRRCAFWVAKKIGDKQSQEEDDQTEDVKIEQAENE